MSNFKVILLSVVTISVLLTNISCIQAKVSLTEEKVSVFKEIVKKIKDTINADVDPCTDYNEYICGNFDENKIVSKSEFATNERFDDEDLKEILRLYLPKQAEKDEVEVKMENFFQSCQSKKTQDVKKFVQNFSLPGAIGRWPAFDQNWDGSTFNLAAAVAEFELLANSVLINTIFTEKDKSFVIKISPKRIFIPDIETIHKKTMELRDTMLLDYGVLNVEEMSSDMILFEKEYVGAIPFDTSGESLEIDFGTLKKKSPEFDWNKYFEILLGKTLHDSTSVIVNNLEGLNNLISKVQKMEPRVVANYFFFQFVRRIHIEFDTNNSCYDRLFLHFESVISRLVVKNLYTEAYKTYLYDMIYAVVETLKESLHDFDGRTIEDIMEKIKNFLENEYLPNLTDETIKQVYAELEIDPSDFYGNILRFYRHYMRVWLQSFPEGKNIGMKTINRRLISYIFIRAIYEYYRKPSPLVFDVIATPLLRRSMIMLAPDKDYDDSVKKCFQRQLNISKELSYSDLVSVKAVQVYMRSFDKWAEKHQDVVAAENELFEEFGLTDRKILFSIHIQSSCRYKEISDQSYLRKLFFSALPNMKDFAEEYNCPIGSPMNPSDRCIIP